MNSKLVLVIDGQVHGTTEDSAPAAWEMRVSAREALCGGARSVRVERVTPRRGSHVVFEAGERFAPEHVVEWLHTGT